MKSKAYILAVSILAFMFPHTEADACGPFWYDAKDYYLYRVYDQDYAGNHRSPDALCLSWQELLSHQIKLDDIEKAMYSYSLEQLDNELEKERPGNTFIRWIKGDTEIREYLRLSKMNEKIRAVQTSKWYYPCKEDGVSGTLEDIISTCLSYQGHRLKDRYTLQALRAMYFLGKFEDMVSYWKDAGKSLPDGTIKDMCLGYMAGAWFRTGARELAIQQYAKLGDLSSLRYSLNKTCPGNTAWQYTKLFSYIAEYCPDNAQVPKLLQEWYRQCNILYECRFIDSATCLKAANNPLCKSPSVWYYTAAFIQDRDGKYWLASKTLEKAEKSRGTEFIEESIKVMRIYLDAKTSVYNKAYEQRLYRQLRWLCSKISGNMTDKARLSTEDGHLLNSNIDYYYWNDMLRKIIIGEVAPRMMEAGKRTLAIRLTNMADNCLLQMVNSKIFYEYGSDDTVKQDEPAAISLIEKRMTLDEYRKSIYSNIFDFSSYLFMMLNGQEYPTGLHCQCMRKTPIAGIKDIAEYVKSISSEEKTPFEYFLDERSFTDLDYFNDIIGTRYLREMQYDKAVTYLSKVSPGYQDRLNTVGYMYRDPFIYLIKPWPIMERFYRSTEIIPDYKLSFAKEMARLDKVIATSTDPNEKGQAMFKKGSGIRSSFSMCWSLTQYSMYFDDAWIKPENNNPVMEISDRFVRDGFRIIRDKETRASLYYEMGLLKTLLEECGDTRTADFVRSNCDNAGDYATNKING